MWFAIFDEEFTKKTLHTEPQHYWIGLNDYYFTFKLLTLNVIKGILNGMLIFYFVFYSLNGDQVSEEGLNGSFWMSSAVLYALVVINANMWVAQRTCTHTGVSTFWIWGSILSYFVFFWLENFFTFSTSMYRIYGHTMADTRV